MIAWPTDPTNATAQTACEDADCGLFALAQKC